MKRLIVLALLCFCFLYSSAFAVDQDGDYKTLCLGDSFNTLQEKLHQLEEKEISNIKYRLENGNGTIIFETTLLEKDVNVELLVIDNILKNITIDLNKDSGSLDMIQSYSKKIAKVLTEKYGKPLTPYDYWSFFAWRILAKNKLYIYKLWNYPNKYIAITFMNYNGVKFAWNLGIGDPAYTPKNGSMLQDENQLKEKAKKDL